MSTRSGRRTNHCVRIATYGGSILELSPTEAGKGSSTQALNLRGFRAPRRYMVDLSAISVLVGPGGVDQLPYFHNRPAGASDRPL